MHYTNKYSQHGSNIWPVWLNYWVFVYERLSGCGFEPRYCHLNFRYDPDSGKELVDIQVNYRV